MKNLKQYPWYTDEKKLHGYRLTMGELQLMIIKAFAEKKIPEDTEIRLVQCDMGEIEKYTIKEWTTHDFNDCYPLLVYDIHTVHYNFEPKSAIVINIADDDHDEEK